MEHLHTERQKISDPLSFWVGCRPQLQILEPVVGSVPVAMMYHFIWEERATKVHRHHQPMLSNLGDASNESTEFRRDGNLSVAMADVPVAVAFPDRLIWQRIAIHQEVFVMSATKAPSLVGTVAFGHGAQPPA